MPHVTVSATSAGKLRLWFCCGFGVPVGNDISSQHLVFIREDVGLFTGKWRGGSAACHSGGGGRIRTRWQSVSHRGDWPSGRRCGALARGGSTGVVFARSDIRLVTGPEKRHTEVATACQRSGGKEVWGDRSQGQGWLCLQRTSSLVGKPFSLSSSHSFLFPSSVALLYFPSTLLSLTVSHLPLFPSFLSVSVLLAVFPPPVCLQCAEQHICGA